MSFNRLIFIYGDTTYETQITKSLLILLYSYSIILLLEIKKMNDE